MTSVGKILVFFNLIFSVGVAALIAIVFSTRTNWKGEFEKMKNTAMVYEAALKEADVRLQNEIRSREESIAALTATRSRLESQVNTAQAAELAAKADLTKAQQAVAAAQVNLDASEKEVKRLQGERDVLGQDKLDREKMVTELTKGINDARQAKVDAENRAKASAYNAEQLRDQLKDVIRERESLRGQLGNFGQGGGRTPSVTDPIVPPPPKDVKGVVTVVSERQDGLAQISIGSNQGLARGNTLVVYRINPNDPKASQYLGELLISKVFPAEAVGQFKPASRSTGALKVGDEVAASVSSR
jgi:hypothetical protein